MLQQEQNTDWHGDLAPGSLQDGLAELRLAGLGLKLQVPCPTHPPLKPLLGSELLQSCLGFCLLLMTSFHMLEQLRPEKTSA